MLYQDRVKMYNVYSSLSLPAINFCITAHDSPAAPPPFPVPTWPNFFGHVKFGREYISVSEYVQISLDELFLPECLCTFVRTVPPCGFLI